MVQVRFIESGEHLRERSVGENARTLTKPFSPYGDFSRKNLLPLSVDIVA